MVTKHNVQNINPTSTNNNPICQKDNPICQKDNPICQKDNPICQKDNPICQKDNLNSITLTLQNQCEICEKILSSKRNYLNHIDICKGKINTLQCIYCNEIFTLSPAKYRHQKICKKRIQSNDLIIPNEEANTIIGTNINNTIINGSIVGTIENQNNINTSNVQNINIVVYNNDPTEKFLNDSHIDNNAISRIINEQNVLETLNNYNRELFSLKENQCIRKTNMRSSDSQIHLGNNKWEIRKDSEIFPKLMCSSANSFSEILTLKRLSKRYPELDKLLHYVGEEGYINTDDINEEKIVKDLFKDSVSSFIRIIYNITKDNNIEI